MMQTKEELEKFYEKADPWEFQTHPEDKKRKQMILDICKGYGPFIRALDIGCGEGWVSKDLPAKKIYGYEVSENAKSRWPKKIKDVATLDLECDLVVATGVLYPQYDYKTMFEMIEKFSSKTIVTCNIKDWEVDTVKYLHWADQVETIEFDYREYTQVLRVFSCK
jgi:hypothetical protein